MRIWRRIFLLGREGGDGVVLDQFTQDWSEMTLDDFVGMFTRFVATELETKAETEALRKRT